MTNPTQNKEGDLTLDKGKVDRPIETPSLSQLKTARATAKRSFTRVINRIYSSITNHDEYEDIQEDESLIVTLLDLVSEAHNDYVSSLDAEAGNQEASWWSAVEATAKKCRADMDIYFQKTLTSSQENADHLRKSKSSAASAIQQQTERTLDKLTEDLAREQEEERELETLQKQLEERRRQVQQERAARDLTTRTERMNLSRCIGLAEMPNDEDAEPNPASRMNKTPKVTWESDGLANWPPSKPPTADSWIEEELNGVKAPPVVTGHQVGAPWMASLMPQFEFPKFNGDPRQWIEFMASFKSLVHDVVPSNALRMGVLRQMLDPNVRASLGMTLNDPNLYPRALEQLKRRYGDPYKIARAHMQALNEMKPFRGDDLNALKTFWYELRGSVTNLQANGGEGEIQCGSNVDRLVEKLPLSLRRQWGKFVYRLRPTQPTLRNLETFLEQVVESEEYAQPSYPISVSTPTRETNTWKPRKPNGKSGRSPTILKVSSNGASPKARQVTTISKPTYEKFCFICKSKDHKVVTCDKFLELSPTNRALAARDSRYCFNCLSGEHRARDCTSEKKCHVEDCKLLHHTLLHGAEKIFPPKVNVRSSLVPQPESQVLLKVIPVRVHVKDKLIDTFAMLDSGSDASLIRQDIANKLGLRGKTNSLLFGNFHGSERIKSTMVNFKISAIDNSFTFEANNAFTIPTLNASRKVNNWQNIKQSWEKSYGIKLSSAPVGEVTVLIGCDIPGAHETLEIKKPPKGMTGPHAIRTPFGWSLFGRTPDLHRWNESNAREPIRHIRMLHQPQHNDLELLIQNFWTLESLGIKAITGSELSKEDQQALEIMNSTIAKVDGHYEIGLPWRCDEDDLPNNKNTALRRFYNLEHRLKKDPKTAVRYADFMEGLLRAGHAVKVGPLDVGITKRNWYLPHHNVYNPNKPDKTRVVFDASATHQGTSLNSALLRGPDFLSSLPGLLMRFREYPIAVSADIEKMFYQVKVAPVDQDVFRFFWRTPGSLDSPCTYKMTVQIFGAISSPSVCAFALRRTAEDNKAKFPEVASKVISNFYVDNYLDSFATETLATTSSKQLIELLDLGGFRLNQWSSSSRKVLAKIPSSERANQSFNIDLDELPIERTLGLFWNCELDKFCFQFKCMEKANTKRQILAAVMSIFDPLGFLSPVVLIPKILMQEIWQIGRDWDELLPTEFTDRWMEWTNDLQALKNLTVPRCYTLSSASEALKISLHIFSDASEIGYGAVAYLRFIFKNTIRVSFVASKALVTPNKRIRTIPELELQSAVIGFRLSKSVIEELRFQIDHVTFWTDSRVVLTWLNSRTGRPKIFVANRIGEILDGSDVSQWRHVPGAMNPADDCSRGLLPSQLSIEHRWFNGPEFLHLTEDCWPTPFSMGPNDQVACVQLVKTEENFSHPLSNLIQKCSSLRKLTRTVAWVLRATKYFRLSKEDRKNFTRDQPVLSAGEVDSALMKCIAAVQNESFLVEVNAIKVGKRIPNNSRLLKLTPYMDEMQLLRVGGRLDRSDLPQEVKHPIILPLHPFTETLIRDVHQRLKHSQTERILSELRSTYWILKGRNTIRRVLQKCISCKKANARPSIPMMASLPRSRLSPYLRPFSICGLDYFGPMHVKYGRGTIKRWVMLVTCMNTRAIHLEMVFSLDTDSFLLAFRKFVGRRGSPSVCYSDNGTCLVAGERELREGIENWNQHVIGDFMSQERIDWRFNPPAAPHFGGVWERLVRSAKVAMKAVLGNQTVSDEVLSTVLTEVEFVLNGRPLTHVSMDPQDPEPITPNHFIHGGRCLNMPPGIFEKEEITGRKRWRASQAMVNEIWKRWLREYVPDLIERRKWLRPQRNICVNDLVLIVDQNSPRGHWPLGKIISVVPGPDDVVRSAVVKTKTGELTRPVSKLCLLEVGEEDVVPEPTEEETTTAVEEQVEQSIKVVSPTSTPATLKRPKKVPTSALLKIGLFCMLFHCVIAKSDILIRDSVLFVERNSMVFSESSWTLVTGIDLSPGIDLISLDNWLVQQQYPVFTPKPDSFNELTQKKSRLEASWRRDRLSNMRIKYQNILGTIPEVKRRQRSLIDGGGTVLKWLFGVSTQEDLEEVHREMAKMGTQQRSIVHAMQQQATIINETLWEHKATVQIISDMDQQQRSLQEALAVLSAEVSDNNESLIKYLNSLLQLDETYSSIDQVLKWFEEWLRELEYSYTLLAMKKLPPQLFPPEQLKEVLRQVEERLPADWTLATGPNDIWTIYQEARVLIAVANGQLRLFITVKLIHKSLEFIMYQVVNLPSSSINGTHKTMYAKLPQYLAVSADQQRFMELSSEDLWDCDLGIHKICHLHQVINKRYPIKTCAISLFLSDEKRWNENCRQLIIENIGTHVVYLGERRWAFSSEKPMEATIHCPSADRVPSHSTVKLPSVGVLEVPPSCTAQTEEWIFPASITGSKEFDVRPVYRKPTLHLEDGAWQSQERQRNSSHIPKKILDLASKNSTIREQLSELLTKNKLSMMKEDLSAAEIDDLINNSLPDGNGGGMFLTSVILIAIVGALALANAVRLLRMWRKTSRRQPTRNSEDAEEPERVPMEALRADRESLNAERGSLAE